jgi:DNA transformation protein
MKASDAFVRTSATHVASNSDVRGVEELRNLGKSSARMLAAAGIRSAHQLAKMGAVPAYLAVKAAGCKPSLNLLWAIEGALTDQDWRTVSREERTSLLLQLDDHLDGLP